MPPISKWMGSQIAGLRSQLLAMGCWYLNPPRGRSWKQNLAAGPVLPVQEQKENRPAWFFFLIASVLSLYWAGTCCSQLLRQPQLFEVHSLDVCWNGSEAAFHPGCKIIIALKMQRCIIPGDYPLVLEIISLSYLFPQLQLLNTYSSEMCLPAMALICFRDCHSYRYAGERHPWSEILLPCLFPSGNVTWNEKLHLQFVHALA